ncbi:MAG: tRNA (N6-isopentenyl adenosine(37)-C2)-methylthiotransferase MiaB [bacterium]
MPTQQQKQRRYFIKTYGCQMNVADSAKLAAVLDANGFLPTPNSKLADLILVNTCVVRQNAEDRAAWYITSMKNLKLQNPNLKIGVCGCLASEPGRDLKEQFPHVDFFIPPNSPEKLAGILKGVGGSKIGGRGEEKKQTSAFVTIMTGCDNFCSYCIVPYVRGRETSRPMDEVLAEIKGLRDQGVKEITLLGQNVNSYKYGLAALLREINKTIHDSRFTIHFLTSHPRDMSDDIITAVAELPYVAKEFHLPIQAGDDEILKKMNRGYTVEYFTRLVKKIRQAMPEANISSDIMVGFPGETEAQFENSLQLLREIKFSMVNMFAYSARPATAAAKLPDQLPEAVKQARLQKLISVNRESIGEKL